MSPHPKHPSKSPTPLRPHATYPTPPRDPRDEMYGYSRDSREHKRDSRELTRDATRDKNSPQSYHGSPSGGQKYTSASSATPQRPSPNNGHSNSLSVPNSQGQSQTQTPARTPTHPQPRAGTGPSPITAQKLVPAFSLPERTPEGTQALAQRREVMYQRELQARRSTSGFSSASGAAAAAAAASATRSNSELSSVSAQSGGSASSTMTITGSQFSEEPESYHDVSPSKRARPTANTRSSAGISGGGRDSHPHPHSNSHSQSLSAPPPRGNSYSHSTSQQTTPQPTTRPLVRQPSAALSTSSDSSTESSTSSSSSSIGFGTKPDPSSQRTQRFFAHIPADAVDRKKKKKTKGKGKKGEESEEDSWTKPKKNGWTHEEPHHVTITSAGVSAVASGNVRGSSASGTWSSASGAAATNPFISSSSASTTHTNGHGYSGSGSGFTHPNASGSGSGQWSSASGAVQAGAGGSYYGQGQSGSQWGPQSRYGSGSSTATYSANPLKKASTMPTFGHPAYGHSQGPAPPPTATIHDPHSKPYEARQFQHITELTSGAPVPNFSGMNINDHAGGASMVAGGGAGGGLIPKPPRSLLEDQKKQKEMNDKWKELPFRYIPSKGLKDQSFSTSQTTFESLLQGHAAYFNLFKPTFDEALASSLFAQFPEKLDVPATNPPRPYMYITHEVFFEWTMQLLPSRTPVSSRVKDVVSVRDVLEGLYKRFHMPIGGPEDAFEEGRLEVCKIAGSKGIFAGFSRDEARVGCWKLELRDVEIADAWLKEREREERERRRRAKE